MNTNKRIVIIEPYAMIAQGLRLMIDDIKGYASTIEHRMDDEWYNMESALEDNAEMLRLAKLYGVRFVLIDDRYEIVFDIDSEAEKNDT